MADLPEERSSDAAPFRYVGMDIFVPFVTEASRKKLKRYGAMAMHLEVVDSMETDSFIMCLTHFIGRRGTMRMLRCNNGSNFIGVEKEVSKSFLEIDQNKIRKFLQNLGSYWIIWKKNPPAGGSLWWNLRAPNQVSKGTIEITTQNSRIQLK